MGMRAGTGGRPVGGFGSNSNSATLQAIVLEDEACVARRPHLPVCEIVLEQNRLGSQNHRGVN